MKSIFSLSWLTSTKPRKQRKFRLNAPLHIKGKFLTSPLSKELKEKYSVKNIRVRKGDKVKILRGQFKGKIGAVDKVFTSKSKIFVTGAELTKKDGSKVAYKIDPSKVVIVDLNLSDKKRLNKVKKGN
jgi:large subunit ribosomal protein L24